MKLINREVGYSVRALIYIAQSGRDIISVSEIVKKLEISKPFMRKILQILTKNNILKSYKGRGGGFSLARPLNKIFLLNLIEVFQGGINLNECNVENLPCPCIDSCRIKDKVDRIQEKVISELKGVRLDALIKNKGNKNAN